jgi:hypothetical protein
VIFNHDLKPWVDGSGRVRYMRSGFIYGIVAMLVGCGPMFLLWFASPYGVPGITAPFDAAGDLGLWVAPCVLVLVMASISYWVMRWRRVMAFDREQRVVGVASRRMFRTDLLAVEYENAAAEVCHASYFVGKGREWKGYALLVRLPELRMVLSRSKDRRHVEAFANTFTKLTGLQWKPVDRWQRLGTFET